jgi:hypothetical protein
MKHFRSPCIHCGQAMEDVAPGSCPGDASKAIPIAYKTLGVRWDGYEHFLVRLSINEVVERWCHTSTQAPYRHFNMLGDIQTPPRYDAGLKLSSPVRDGGQP